MKIFLILFFLAFKPAIAENKGDYRYFTKFYTNYSHPFRVEIKSEISLDQTINKNVYYKVLFDEKLKIVELSKILNNNCIFKFLYSYKSNGDLLRIKRSEDC